MICLSMTPFAVPQPAFSWWRNLFFLWSPLLELFAASEAWAFSEVWAVFWESLRKCSPLCVYPGRHPPWEPRPASETWAPFPAACLATINQAVQIACFVIKSASADVCVISCCLPRLFQAVTWSRAFSGCPGCWGISCVIKAMGKGAGFCSSALCEGQAAGCSGFSKGNKVPRLLWGSRIPCSCMNQHFVRRKQSLCVSLAPREISTDFSEVTNELALGLLTSGSLFWGKGWEIIKSWRKMMHLSYLLEINLGRGKNLGWQQFYH